MRMKKENMDHIRERFEKETGVKLPEKESFESPAWTGRILAAAAGLICLAGLGLVWHRVSVDKQETAETAETLLAGGEVDYAATDEETEEAPETVDEESDSEELTPDNNERSSERTITISTDGEDLPDTISANLIDNQDLTLYYSVNEAKEVVDISIFGSDTDWTWPVSSSKCAILSKSYACTSDSISSDPDNSYRRLSIPGAVGDEVVAMHSCNVTETGFDTDRGNYIITEFNKNNIIYSHLDTICVSEGDHLNNGDKIGTLGNTGASTGPHLGITVTDAFGNALRIISVSPEDDGFYSEEIIEE